MTKLDCSVRNCKYNDENACCKGAILVSGEKANHCEETCCSSFASEGQGGFNSAYEPKEYSDISCDATKCTFNENHKCVAEHIGVAGANATEKSETECASFRLNA